MNGKLRRRWRNRFSMVMAVLIVFAGIFQPDAGIVEAADSQVVDGMTIEDGVVVSYEGDAECVVIPDGVTGIGYSAFSDCKELKEITIPESVKRIEAYAFMNCESLSAVTIPEGVTAIEFSAFENCGLSTVELPESVTTIETYAFRRCSKLEHIELGGVTTIEKEAFSYCTMLKELNLPDGVTAIGVAAFRGCHGLNEIRLPDGLTSIGTEVFRDCINLTTVELPKNLESIEELAFSNCGLKKVELPDGVISIGSNAFSSCGELEEIKIPKGVTSVGNFAFVDCTAMVSVDIPSSVTEIGTSAFGYYSVYDASNKTISYLPREGYIIVGESGTAAEQYAKENGFKFAERRDPVELTEGSNTVSSADLQELAEANKDQKITIINGQGISFIFNIGEMKLAAGVDSYDFSISVVADYAQLSDPKFEEGEFVFGIQPVMSGEFPGNADLIIPVDEMWIGRTLYVYSLSEDGSCQYIGKECVVSENAAITVKNADGQSLVFATKAAAKLGDVDGDGEITAKDALAFLKHDIGIQIDIFIQEAADVNKDDKIDAKDALNILKYGVGLLQIL